MRKWVKKIERCIIAIKPQKKHRDTVAVDETKVKVNGIQLFVWNAIDIKKNKRITGIQGIKDKKDNRCSYYTDCSEQCYHAVITGLLS